MNIYFKMIKIKNKQYEKTKINLKNIRVTKVKTNLVLCVFCGLYQVVNLFSPLISA